MKTGIALLLIIFSAMTPIRSTVTGKTMPPKIKEEKVTYSVGNTQFKGIVFYDENLKTRRPAVLVVHEWWGLNNYPAMRARKLAELGYIAMAVDMFGEGKVAANPTEAQSLTQPFYKDPQLAKGRFDAAMDKLRSFKETDPQNIFAIGYCFGGAIVLNMARMGEPLKGVVSFHGGLAGIKPEKGVIQAPILVCHGGADKFVSEADLNNFKHQMDSAGAHYKVIVYANATHAFTNPEATAIGKKFNMPIEYNQKADQDSWNDMKAFFQSILKK